jgi:D-aminopeptidase
VIVAPPSPLMTSGRLETRRSVCARGFGATVEATEEAVLNALWAAETTTGRLGRAAPALPHEPVLELLEAQGRLSGPR